MNLATTIVNVRAATTNLDRAVADLEAAFVANPPCTLIPGRPAVWTVDFGNVDVALDGKKLVINGRVFRLRFGSLVVAGPGEVLIDEGSAPRDTAACIVINQEDIGVHCTANDPVMTVKGPVGLTITSDVVGLIITEVDAGAAWSCA